MKLFYYFQELETNMFQWQRVHFIEELSHHDVDFNVFNPLVFETPEEANAEALKELGQTHYDLFFTNVCYHKMLFVDTLDRIKRMGIPTLSFRCDNLIMPFNDRVLAPHFDLVWITSRETQYLYDKWGVRSVFAPYASNPFTFSYIQSELIRRICFIGTPYGSRSLMINTLTNSHIDVDAFSKPSAQHQAKVDDINILSEIKVMGKWATIYNYLKFIEGRTVLYGSVINRMKGATKLDKNDFLEEYPFVAPNQISSLYSQYALCLSSTSANHTDTLAKPLKIVNLRAFEVPMSGGIIFCKYNPELAEYFEDGKEAIYYESNDDLIDKALYYTIRASESEIRSIKLAARKRAEGEHTWWHRFTIVLDVLDIKHS